MPKDSRDSRYDILFEPMRIGPKLAKNRFYQVPHCNGGGYRDPSAVVEMRRTKAEGGWGVIFTEQTEIHPSSEITPFIEEGVPTSTIDRVAYEFARDRAYHFTAIAPAGRAATFNPMFQSMRRITQAEAGAVVPKKLQVVTVARGDTVASLARRMAYDSAQEDRFRVLNALGSSDTVTAGQKVKLVVRAR